VLTIPEGGYRNRITQESVLYKERPDGAVRRAIDMAMDGMAVFNAAVKHAPLSIGRVIESSGISGSDHDCLILHQANLMLIKHIAGKLGFKGDRFPMSIQKYGNVSSASIPLTICSELRDVIGANGSRMLMSAFGAGFSVGSASVEIGPCPCAGVVKY
jgi:3-oxoacyl-[acyl-carrier-protein] synthase-3